MKILKTIFWWGLTILLVLFILFSFYQGINSSNKCRDFCNDFQGFLVYDIIHSNHWSYKTDICVCYLKQNNEIKVYANEMGDLEKLK